MNMGWVLWKWAKTLSSTWSESKLKEFGIDKLWMECVTSENKSVVGGVSCIVLLVRKSLFVDGNERKKSCEYFDWNQEEERVRHSWFVDWVIHMNSTSYEETETFRWEANFVFEKIRCTNAHDVWQVKNCGIISNRCLNHMTKGQISQRSALHWNYVYDIDKLRSIQWAGSVVAEAK